MKVSKLVACEGKEVTSEQSKLFSEIMEKSENEFDESTPMGLLWQQQLEQSRKHAKGMRWHPLIIRWCLSIYHKSPAAYRQIASKRNEFLRLPHVSTLKKYINFTEPVSGFNPDIIKQLIIDSKIETLDENEKSVSLLFDEMKVQEDLVYKKSTGKIIGYTEMGDLNEEISRFQTRCLEDTSEEESSRKFATHVNVFMVRGICSSLCYPFGYHASIGFTGDQLFDIVWEATRVLESIGFKVRAWVCDGAPPNRKLFRMNENSKEEFYFTTNQYAPDRKIYFISDTPHLLKTTRNNVENSHGHRNSRNLHVC